MRAVGYTCLIAALGAAAYALYWTGTAIERVVAFAGLAVIAGLALIIAERVTRSRLKLATEVEAAASRALADAATVRAIGEELARHRETSTKAVAQTRKDAEHTGQQVREAKQRTDDLVQTVDTAKAAQARLGDLADFNMLITRANSDDREAFDSLNEIMTRGKEDPRAGVAQRVVFSLLSDQRLFVPIPDHHWSRYDFDPNQASLAEYSRFINTARVDLAAQAILKLRTQDRLPQRDRFMMLTNLIQHTKSIRLLEAACEAIGDEARIRKNILAWREYLTWWHANETRYQ